MDRRLSAILAADIVGYTRLMGQDEAATLDRVIKLRRETIEPMVERHRGRIFKLTGDGILVEFPTVTNAVECALDWQSSLAAEEAERDPHRRIIYRIGVNLGEVILEGDDLYGEGVNLAARLEGVADPGGISLSGDAFRQVRGKIDAEFVDRGQVRLKNVAEPVQVYAAKTNAIAPPAQAAAGARPSVAVLPLINMSGEADQDYFSNGITEDIITELSRFRILSVASRTASFAFKSDHADISAIAQKLGVQFIVQGSVRRAGKRVRITVQLIEAETGDHVWAERYDRDLEDVFAVQDEVTRSIVGVLPGRVQGAVAHRAARRPPDSIRAYEVMLQGKALRDSFSAGATERARRLFEKSIQLDPQYGRAYSYLADTYFVDSMLGLGTEETKQEMVANVTKAIELDPADVSIQEERGFAYIVAGQWEDASTQFDRTIAQIGIESEQLLWCAYGLAMLGRHEEALTEIHRAKSYDPLHPPSFDWVLGQALFFTGNYEQANAVLKAAALLNSLAYACRTGAYAYLGRKEQARAALAEFIAVRQAEFRDRKFPEGNISVEALIGGYRDTWRRQEDWERIAEGLRLAGLPS